MNLLLIGDTIIDKNIYLEATGLSLESPTIKTKYVSENLSYGGAANVAKFCSVFGLKVTFITSVKDSTKKDLEKKYNINIINIEQQKENIKSRFYIKKGDNIYNYLQINDVNTEEAKQTSHLDLKGYHSIAVSDYRCGLLTDELKKIIQKQKCEKFVASQISSNNPNFDSYKKVDYFVCNENESQYLSNLHNVYITKGSGGCEFNGKIFPSEKVTPVQTIGAGDCFYAALLAFRNPNIANEMAKKYVLGKL